VNRFPYFGFSVSVFPVKEYNWGLVFLKGVAALAAALFLCHFFKNLVKILIINSLQNNGIAIIPQ